MKISLLLAFLCKNCLVPTRSSEVNCTSSDDCPKQQICCNWDNVAGVHSTGVCGEMCISSFNPTNCTTDSACPNQQTCCNWDNVAGVHSTGVCGEMCISSFNPTNCTTDSACPNQQTCCNWDNVAGVHSTGVCGEMCISVFNSSNEAPSTSAETPATTTSASSTSASDESTTIDTNGVETSSSPTTSVEDSTTAEAIEALVGSLTFSSVVLTKVQVEVSVRRSLAQELAVDEANISVTAVESRRLAGQGWGRRLAGNWDVTFSVIIASSEVAAAMSRASAIKSDPTSFQQAMKTHLQDLGVSETDSAIVVNNFEALLQLDNTTTTSTSFGHVDTTAMASTFAGTSFSSVLCGTRWCTYCFFVRFLALLCM